MILILFVLLRAILGPTVIDRLLSINAITSKVCVIILLMAYWQSNYSYVDVALVFILCGFVANLWILRVLTPDDWELDLPGLGGFRSSEEEVVSHD